MPEGDDSMAADPARTEKHHDPTNDMHVLEREVSPPSPANDFPALPFIQQNRSSLDLDAYFSGPRDLRKHSKWPLFMQMQGSILPSMILPLFLVACWATALTCVSILHHPLGISNILLTVLGFVVSLGLSLRSSTAYERYGEGRKYWSQLTAIANNLGRVFWIHMTEREGEEGKKDVLAKLSAMNLVVAFAVALKHKLRYEPYTGYDDIMGLVGHLDTWAGRATREEPDKANHHTRRSRVLKHIGDELGIPFVMSNPRKWVKRSERPLGNLPLEIMTYLAAFIDGAIANGQFTVPFQQNLAYNNIAALNDVLTGTERILTTPMPIAYAISIAQVTWVYIIVLPFQLLSVLGWMTIPATVISAYIILGLLFIGREIEDPFGQDVNDLPLDAFCEQIATEMDLIASRIKPRVSDWVESNDNLVLFPFSSAGFPVWDARGPDRVHEALLSKVEINFINKKQAEKEAKAGRRKSRDAPALSRGNASAV